MSMLKSLLLTWCVTGLSASGCASTPASVGATTSTDGAPASTPASAARPDRDVISQQELAVPALRALSVLEVIRTLRPHFLNIRGKNSQSDPEAGRVHASIDYNGVIPLDDLRNLHVTGITEIRFLGVGPAMQKFGGAAHEGPVIVVKTL